MNYKRLTFILLVFSTFLVPAQEYHFKSYTTDEGLSNNSVMDIENDESGALWIATWDGLNYFDGTKFTVYKNSTHDSTSLSGNEIYQIVKDKNKQIWVRTDKSISKYMGNGTFKNYTFSKRIRSLNLSKNNTPIITFSENYFLEWHNNEFKKSTEENIKKEGNSIFKNLLLSKKPGLIINDIYKEKKENNLLFATQDNGLYVLKASKNKFDVINYKKDLYSSNGINSNEIEKIHEDVFGGVWLGFKDGGISLIQKTLNGVTTIAPHPKDFPNLPTETIRAIIKDDKSRLWLGYYTKGLYYFNRKKEHFLPFDIPKAKENKDWNRIRCLYKTSDNALWVGTYAGIIRIFDKKLTYYSADDYDFFPNNRTYSLFENNNKLWVSCWSGLAKMDLKTLKFEHFKGQETLNTFNIRQIYVHQKNILLATQNNGLIIFDTKKGTYKAITEQQGLSGNSVFSILYDNENENFWIACLGGITVFNKDWKEVKTFTESDGLPSHMVYGLLKEKKNIWASTTKGITKIDKQEFVVKSVSPDENWQAKEFSEGAYYKDDTFFYFGGVKGVSFFTPKNIKTDNTLPKIHIEIEGASDSFNVIKNSTENFLKIKITPIFYEKNLNNKVLYRLEGFDKNWKILGKQNLFYKQLPAGSFTFKVKNSLDFSDKNIISYKIKIKKPFYLTTWFLTFIATLILLTVVLNLHKRSKLSKAYQKKLELEIERRTKTISAQKTELLNLHNSIKNNEFEIDKFQTFVVEKFKQPLTVILENVSSSLMQPEKKAIIIEQTKDLMNKVVQWNYLENVNNLDDYNTALVSIDTLKHSFSQYNQQFLDYGISYKINLENNYKFIEIDLVRYKLLIQYLFNDIIKFNKKDTQFNTHIYFTESKMTINLISDNRLLQDNIEYIQKFSPYYKAFIRVLEGLEGKVAISNSENLNIIIEVPINSNTTLKQKESNSIALNDIELPDDKTIYLIYANKEDVNVASCILESDKNHLVFESDENLIYKLLHKTKRFDVLVLYNVSFTKKIVDVLSSIQKNNLIPSIYISESIDYSLQEKITTFNINEIVQLPTNKKFILNKINKLLTNFSSEVTLHNEKITSPNEKLLNKAVAIIKENYSNSDFNVDYLADKLSISRIKCYRIFKEVLKQTPSDTIMQHRMKMASELIGTTSLNVSEISSECGFNDPKYFGKVFKKYYGVNPKNYRTT